MKKLLKAVAAIMLMTAVVFIAGCKPEDEPDNGGGNNGGDVNAPAGAIDGIYSVSDMDEVYFSQGNLQYQASTNTWRFAEKQYDALGQENSNISSFYSGWIDLFGWGTSGYDNKYPYMTSTDNDDYGNGDDISGTNYDWGVYNRISNGGDEVGLWRTLTAGEWNYLFYNRQTTSGVRFVKAQVNGVNGMILVPDDWNVATFSFNSINDGKASYTSNVVDEEVWQNTIEPAGAVFLPSAGYRYATSVSYVGSWGVYWSATYNNNFSAYGLYCDGSYLYPLGDDNFYTGRSVRLVRSAQ